MKSARFAVALAVIALFVFVCSQKLPAQALFGTISGIVTDPSGAAVPGATVKVTNSQTNVTSTLKTNAAGVYNASSLNPGVYTLAAEAKGFKTSVVKNITLEVNANPKVDLTLSVGAINEVVVVTAANTPILQTQESDLGQTVNEQQLEQLPTQSSSGRNIYSLIPLAQGVSEQVGQGGYGN